ncbi:hypothetical protein ACQJBY_069375 [Aegilops geniculata]
MATPGKSNLMWNTGELADRLIPCFAIKLMKQGDRQLRRMAGRDFVECRAKSEGNLEGWLGVTLSSVEQKYVFKMDFVYIR